MARTPGSGRQKGTPNRTTQAVKEAILDAFASMGGVDYLKIVARDEPKVFCQLLAKILPSEVRAEIQHTTLLVRDYTGEVHEIPFQRQEQKRIEAEH